MKKTIAILVYSILLTGFSHAQILTLDAVLKTIDAKENLEAGKFETKGDIDPSLKEDADFFLSQFNAAFQSVALYATNEKMNKEFVSGIIKSNSEKLVFNNIDEYLVKYPDDKFAFELNINLKKSANSEEFASYLNSLKTENINQGRTIYLMLNIIPIVKNHFSVNGFNSGDTERSWWKIFKCVAGTVGGAIGGGVAGCAGVGAVGGTVGALGGPAGAAAGAAGGCIVGGIAGAIGGGLIGAAQYCGD